MAFLKKCWYVAAWSHELKAGEIISRTIANTPIALYRTADGVVAMEDRCAHKAAPLSKGRIEDGGIRCMYHGFKYAAGGACVEIPGQKAVPKAACVRTFAAVEHHSWIWIWLGNPVDADPQLIPAAVGLDDPRWSLRCGHIDYRAHYELINDNLTDFSHVSYVHAKSFGATEEFALTRPHIEPLERGLRIWRWLLAGYSEDSYAETKGRYPTFESFETYDYLVPGVLIMHSILCPDGTAARFNGELPDLASLPIITERFSSQAVTPMTDRSSRYFYSSGPRSSAQEAAGADERFARASQAFIEDKEMIEGQQVILDSYPDRPLVLTSCDVGPQKFRALIARLIKDESAEAPVG